MKEERDMEKFNVPTWAKTVSSAMEQHKPNNLFKRKTIFIPIAAFIISWIFAIGVVVGLFWMEHWD